MYRKVGNALTCFAVEEEQDTLHRHRTHCWKSETINRALIKKCITKMLAECNLIYRAILKYLNCF